MELFPHEKFLRNCDISVWKFSPFLDNEAKMKTHAEYLNFLFVKLNLYLTSIDNMENLVQF